MKSISSKIKKAALVCSLSAMAVSGAASLAAAQSYPQYGSQDKDQSKDKTRLSPPSQAEQQALAKVEAAPDAAAKALAASEFVKKYPKSTLRPKLVSYLAHEIDKLPDEAQRITQFESMLTMFSEPGDAQVITPILIDLYFKANRLDDGFRVASSYLAKEAKDLAVLTQVAMTGFEQAKKSNPKFVQPSQQYGAKAIELIESGKKPDTFDDARWGEYQTKWLPALYQSLGLVSLMTGNAADARAKLDKALSLNPSDPFSYVLVGSLVNDEYQKLAEQHKTMTPGPMKDALLKQAQAKIDEVVDLYAHAVGLSEGNAAYQQLHDQILEDLQTYYKYRHGGSADGLQPLIDKYKKP